MPRLACRACGRQIYTVAPLESLFAEERRCPRCGAYMDAGAARRRAPRRASAARTRPTTPGPPPATGERRAGERRVCRPAPGVGLGAVAAGRCASPCLGLGLIGGSIARALRADAGRLVASRPGRRAGRARGSPPRPGSIDRRRGDAPEAAIDGADLVVLAAPPLACLELLRDLGGPLRAIPAAGRRRSPTWRARRRAIVARAGELGLRFVGGHPMAGRETSGFEASDAGLFARPAVGRRAAGRGDEAAMARGRGARAAPAARGRCAWTPTSTIAPWRRSATCRSCSSAALVEAVAGGRRTGPTPDWPAASALAASGWASMTRLARGDVDDGRRASRPRTPAAIAARLRDVRDRSSTSGSRCSRRRADADADPGPRSRRRGARAGRGRLRWASPASRSSSSRATSIVPGPGWLGVRRDGIDARRWTSIAARRAASCRAARGAGPALQAGDPVPRPARRRALVPDAPDARRRRRAAPRPLVDRRRRPPEPGRRRRRRRPAPRVGRGARGGLRARVRACRAAQRRHDRGRRGPRRVVFVADAAGRPVAIRETDKLDGRVRRPPRRSRAVVRRHGDLEPARVRRRCAS